MTLYRSTRGGNEVFTASQAIIAGIARNKGLFVPTEIPTLPFELEDMVGADYKKVAFEILKVFLADFTDEELHYCIDSAYDRKFAKDEIVPLVQAGMAHFLELYHGKTSAFKDMALSILPYLMTTAMKKEKVDKKVCILTATSGDTGKAALEGFADVEGTEIAVFYPSKGVSRVQELQMTTQVGANTHVFAIDGNFDDAQRGVKEIFADESFSKTLLKKGFMLSSANSINIGRLIPQIVYYVYAYLKLLDRKVISSGQAMNIVVPTGNFGNILAAYYSNKMGINIKMFICASNKNRILTDFLTTGIYDTRRDFYLTNSPSMDILLSSNLERLLYHICGESSRDVAQLMNDLETKGFYSISSDTKIRMKKFFGDFADVDETLKTIGSMYRKHGYILDTHTAVAYHVFQNYQLYSCDQSATVIASTASPYKFPLSVAKAIGLGDYEDDFQAISAIHEETGLPVPHGLSELTDKPILHDLVINKECMAQAVLSALKIED